MRHYFSLLLLFVFAANLVFAQITIDGDLSESLYQVAATKQNSNNGFGSNIDVSKIVYYADDASYTLYIGIVGKLNTASNDGIGLWINSSSVTGIGNGSSLAISGGGHYISGDNGNHQDFKADFEVDYMFALNTGASNSFVYLDAGSQVLTPPKAHYQGSCNQSGTSANNSSENGTVFTKDALTFAFNNDGGSNHGFEIAIPYSEIGAYSGETYQFFAFVVSSTAYFSDVTVPGNVSGGNLGYDPNFGSISGGPYHSSSSAVPVELTSFTASISGASVKLNWEAATEINNYGFEIERAAENSEWQKIGFVEGAGNSNSPKKYSFTDNVGKSGSYSYRLKQIDVNGDYKYSQIVEVSVGLPTKFELKQNYPNPFNPTTTIKYSIPSVIARSEATRQSAGMLVQLKVYDMLGREVATLVNREQTPGNYAVEFDASRLSSGVYFYTLKAGEFAATKKMILMK